MKNRLIYFRVSIAVAYSLISCSETNFNKNKNETFFIIELPTDFTELSNKKYYIHNSNLEIGICVPIRGFNYLYCLTNNITIKRLLPSKNLTLKIHEISYELIADNYLDEIKTGDIIKVKQFNDNVIWKNTSINPDTLIKELDSGLNTIMEVLEEKK